MSTLEEIQAARAARKEAKAAREQEQLVEDLTAINELEIEHGDENIATLRVAFTEGSPVMVAVRTPKPGEMKRYQSRLKQKNADATAAAEEVGKSCVVYPKGEAFDTLCERRPGFLPQVGLAALHLVVARSESEGKE